MALYLDKDQRAEYRAELEKVWADPKMIEYCLKSASMTHTIRGRLITLDKPAIKTRFYWGENGYDFDEKNELASQMSKNEMFFIMENLDNCKASALLEQVKWALNPDSPNFLALAGKQYTGQKDNCKLDHLKFFSNRDWFDGDREQYEAEKLTVNELESLEKVLLRELEKFEKRLHAYLKRYGLSKCTFETYWADA